MEGSIHTALSCMWHMPRHTSSFLLTANALVYRIDDSIDQQEVLEIAPQHDPKALFPLGDDVLQCHGHKYFRQSSASDTVTVDRAKLGEVVQPLVCYSKPAVHIDWNPTLGTKQLELQCAIHHGASSIRLLAGLGRQNLPY